MSEKARKVERKETAKQKMATKVDALVNRSAELLRALERHEPRKIYSLVIADTMALRTNARLQGNMTKPKTKTEGLEQFHASEHV